MAETQHVGMRIPPELVDAARRGASAPDASLSVLVRAGLARLAGLPVHEALATAQARPGPKPKAQATNGRY
jgi:hypothetical protein